MTEKRYKRLVSSIDYYYCIDTTNDDKGLTEDDMLNLLNEQNKTIKELERETKSYMDDAIKFEKECKRLYNNLRLTNSDLYYEKIVHDKCKKENEQLKETIKELELENAKHIGDGEWDIRDITYGHGKFRLEEWGERYHQFYNGDKQLEDEEVVSLLFENEQLKKKILEEIDLGVAYVDETYSDGRMSKEQHNGAIISLRQLREKFE